MAAIGTIAARPSTPVVAAAIGIVPLYDVPIIAVLPLCHVTGAASVAPSRVV
jgi:hypothetical protein